MTQVLSRLKDRRNLSIAGAVALVIAVVLVIVALVAGGSDDDDGGSAGTDTPGRIVNQAGGYEITIPQDWTSEQLGRVTRLKSPTSDATMEIAPGRPGSLDESAALLYQQVARNYDFGDRSNLPTNAEVKEVAGRPWKLLAATARNKDGLDIRFLTITVADTPNNWWLTIYVPEASNPDETVPTVTKIAESFKPR